VAKQSICTPAALTKKRKSCWPSLKPIDVNRKWSDTPKHLYWLFLWILSVIIQAMLICKWHCCHTIFYQFFIIAYRFSIVGSNITKSVANMLFPCLHYLSVDCYVSVIRFCLKYLFLTKKAVWLKNIRVTEYNFDINWLNMNKNKKLTYKYSFYDYLHTY
jgi:hypothetical protein